jgi:hypothetical protein
MVRGYLQNGTFLYLRNSGHPVSNIAPVTGYSDFFCSFPQSVQANFWIVPYQFIIHLPPFHSTLYRLSY